ncbi:hypothetical protein ACROYT_G009388 [Oculina patagonica]
MGVEEAGAWELGDLSTVGNHDNPGAGDEDDDDDDDSIDWDSSDEESSSSDSDIGGEGGPEDKGKQKKKVKEKKTTKLKFKEGDDVGGWTEVKGSSLSSAEKVKQLFPKDTEITHAVVLKKLHEILSARGKKGTDRTDQIEFLKQLRVISDNAKSGTRPDRGKPGSKPGLKAGVYKEINGAGMTVKLLFNIISSIFDYNPNVATCMKAEMWQECLKQIDELSSILIDNQETLTIGENISEESENVDFFEIILKPSLHHLEGEKDSAEVEKPEKPVEQQKKEGPSSSEKVDKMCKFIYSRDTSDRIRTRAMLCHVYHHALHDRWFEARDLMLMSHLQESIQHSDIPTQILYNRTMVQLGLCAFRHGMIKDAHNALHDVQSSGRAKELLAQGLMQQRQYERTPEQEKIEKRRQPTHMTTDHVFLARVFIISYDKVKSKPWLVWKLFRQTEQVQEMLTRKIQEESLRTYLFTYNSVYDSLSLYTLAEMFDLPPSVVHSTISKMIINEELQASWDEPTQTVVMHRGAEPSLLQSLALQLADKVSNLVENNERIYDTRHGGFVQFKDRQGQGRYRRQNQQHYDRQDRPEKQDRQDRYNWQERYGRQHDRSYQKSQSSY